MRLAINIDHIATLREARGGVEPDPVAAAAICEIAGAEGIVCHLREDRRHINDRDVRLLRETVKTKLDLEMAATDEIIGIAIDVLPDLVTLVPEHRQELTTEGGIDVVAQRDFYGDVIKEFHGHEIPVSLFIEPEQDQIETAAAIETDMIEIHTGQYANAVTDEEIQEHLEKIRTAAALGKKFQLDVNAGHGLNYVNIIPFRRIHDIDEVSIGHAVISRAVLSGLETAVRDMVTLVRE
ncbi:MAG: pyridoxine 5'-phosphate synthase [Bacteroidota bacterium]